MYECQRCGVTVNGLAAARKHAKQGHRTQRDAFQAGELHNLHLVGAEADYKDFQRVQMDALQWGK